MEAPVPWGVARVAGDRTVSAAVCVVCKAPLGEGAIRVRYEGRAYSFDRLACKMTFAENPDRWLDANGEVLSEPR